MGEIERVAAKPDSAFISARCGEAEATLATATFSPSSGMSRTQLLELLEGLYQSETAVQDNIEAASVQIREFLKHVVHPEGLQMVLDCMRSGRPTQFEHPEIRSLVIDVIGQYAHEADVAAVLVEELLSRNPSMAAPAKQVYGVLSTLPSAVLKRYERKFKAAVPMWDSESFYKEQDNPAKFYAAKLLRQSMPELVEKKILRRAVKAYEQAAEIEVRSEHLYFTLETQAALDDLAKYGSAKSRDLLVRIASGRPTNILWFRDWNNRVSAYAAHLLAGSVSDSSFADIFAKQLCRARPGEDQKIVAAWTEALVKFPAVSAVQILSQRASSKSPRAAAHCWAALARINTPEAKAFMEEALRSSDWQRRVAAREALVAAQPD